MDWCNVVRDKWCGTGLREDRERRAKNDERNERRCERGSRAIAQTHEKGGASIFGACGTRQAWSIGIEVMEAEAAVLTCSDYTKARRMPRLGGGRESAWCTLSASSWCTQGELAEKGRPGRRRCRQQPLQARWYFHRSTSVPAPSLSRGACSLQLAPRQAWFHSSPLPL